MAAEGDLEGRLLRTCPSLFACVSNPGYPPYPSIFQRTRFLADQRVTAPIRPIPRIRDTTWSLTGGIFAPMSEMEYFARFHARPGAFKGRKAIRVDESISTK